MGRRAGEEGAVQRRRKGGSGWWWAQWVGSVVETASRKDLLYDVANEIREKRHRKGEWHRLWRRRETVPLAPARWSGAEEARRVLSPRVSQLHARVE